MLISERGQDSDARRRNRAILMNSYEKIQKSYCIDSTARVVDATLIGMAVAPRSNWSFLKLTMDDGAVGTGEVTLRAHEGLISALLSQLMPAIKGSTCNELASLRRAYPGIPSGRMGNALLSALDQACMDLAGQYAGLPISKLWGGAAERPLDAYATVNRSVTSRSPQGFADACEAAVRAGFRAVKVMPFDAMTPQTAHTPEGRAELDRVVERLFAIRRAIGPDVSLMVDCHWRLSEAVAIGFLDAVADLRLHWLECPVPESAEWHPVIKRLRHRANRANVLLAGAENIVGWSGALPFLEAGLYDVVMPDIKYCGGYGEFARIAEGAAHYGVSVSPHNPSGPVAHAHTVHLCAALDLRLAVEQQFAESPLFDACANGQLPLFHDGRFSPAGAPGLGFRIDELIAMAHPPVPVALSMTDPSFA
jgi:galactonate dehydratase